MTGPRITEDPDGWAECYSDHASDISYYGECSFCTSADPDVVGHILPDDARVTGLDPVQAAQQVIDTRSAILIDGILLDHFTATAIIAVHSRLSTTAARRKLRDMSLTKAATVCFRLINQASSA